MTHEASSLFDDREEFLDDLWGGVRLNRIESDCIDTPEFQRLFRVAQLGLVDLVYHTANHSRGIHSIGACAKAKELVDHLNENTPRISAQRKAVGRPNQPLPTITRAERFLISLAGLLHDIPHAPFSHDIEKKTHRYNDRATKVKSYYGPYEKHDDFEENPALYVLLFDRADSILARVLAEHSSAFWRLLVEDAAKDEGAHLRLFVEACQEWPERDRGKRILPSLLFHLLVFESVKDALRGPTINLVTSFDTEKREKIKWGLGPAAMHEKLHRAWYQPYRHDIVGDTLSADLLDYLHRDARRLGMQKSIDPKLLDVYTLVAVPQSRVLALGGPSGWKPERLAQCAIDLNDYKRGVIRSERINDVFRMVDFRHEIHEKAVFHRVVQGAIAMLARAIALAGDERPTIAQLYQVGSSLHALQGDDLFLQQLADLPRDGHLGTPHSRLARKLIERRIYRPLMILSGDQAFALLKGADAANSPIEEREEWLRRLGAILDSQYFAPFLCTACWLVERLLDHSFESMQELEQFVDGTLTPPDPKWMRDVLPRRVILWTTPYKQLYKDPGIVVRANEAVGRIDELVTDSASSAEAVPASVLERLRSGLVNAESQYAAMWKIYVFGSDGLFYTGGLASMLDGHKCRSDEQAHLEHLRLAESFLIRVIKSAWHWFQMSNVSTNVSRLDLESVISDDDLKKLWQVCLSSPFDAAADRPTGVNFDELIHIDSDENCRDIRYRFGETANLQECMDLAGLSGEQMDSFREVLKLAKIDLAKIGNDELMDIVSHLGRHDFTEVQLDLEDAARRGVKGRPSIMRDAWRQSELKIFKGGRGRRYPRGLA
ncbi:MAG: HD domain-containing protein [Gemmatimonadaceae bacterium]